MSRDWCWIALPLVLADVSFQPPAAVQLPAHPRAVATQLAANDVLLRAWLDIVALYRSGDARGALHRIRSWPEARRAKLGGALRAGLERGAQDAGTITLRDAEASILLVLVAAYDAFASDADGRRYLKLAVDLADLLDEADADVRRGVAATPRLVSRVDTYFLAGAIALSQWVLDVASTLSRRGLDHAPTDASLLLLAGSVEEALAIVLERGRPAPVDDADQSWTRYPGVVASLAAVQGHRMRAREHYARALEQDPARDAARVRRAWLVMADGRPDEARRDLERVASGARDPIDRYLACLFLGRLHARVRRFDDAARHYRAAIAAAPRAQAARLGLAYVLDQQGDEQAARRAGEDVLELPSDGEPSDDPWWTYIFGPFLRAAQHHQHLFERLRTP